MIKVVLFENQIKHFIYISYKQPSSKDYSINFETETIPRKHFHLPKCNSFYGEFLFDHESIGWSICQTN